MSLLLHLTTEREWTAALAMGEYRPPSLESEKFIHLSTPSQIARTANRFFAGRTDLVLLGIDPARLHAPVQWEDTIGHGLFPHLYGPLNPEAVVLVHPFLPDADGAFHVEENLIRRA